MKALMNEIRKQTLTLMTAALGFVAALVWKDAITSWMKPLYESADGATGLTIAAIIVTIVVIVITMLLAKLLGEKEEE